jgi:serine/threonine-protein kinase
VHRDLKPSNLFLTRRSDGAALIKVLDFGISKTTQSELDRATGNLTAARSVLGTPFYMSPEQIRDAKQVDFRTDIWSLGLILHELLSASPAFDGTTMPGVCAAIAADPPAALRLKRPEVPIELEAIVLKCLEKDPNKRFQDVRDLAARLGPYTGRPDSSVLLLPPSDKTIRSSPLMLGISELQGNPTIAQPAPSSDTGTMASAKLGAVSEPAVAGKTPLHNQGPQTLSAQSTTTAASALAFSASRSAAAQRSLYYIGAGLVALITVGVLVLRRPVNVEPTPAGSLVAASPLALPTQSAGDPARRTGASFALEISANAPGAQVFEGDTLLGNAPLRLSIDASTVATLPRTFSVKKPGFAPYTIVQGASLADVSVRAELSPEPAPATRASAPKTSKPKKAAPTKSTPTKPAPPTPPSDIFMQR